MEDVDETEIGNSESNSLMNKNCAAGAKKRGVDPRTSTEERYA